MHALYVLLPILCILVIAYRYYSAFIAAKILAVDPQAFRRAAQEHVAPDPVAAHQAASGLAHRAKALEAQASQIARLRQDIEDAEHTRDAANLARMRVFGQLNTLHKTLTAATPS